MKRSRASICLSCLALCVACEVASAQATNWRKSVSTDRRTGERVTSVTTTSVNAVTAFGRTGHGTLSISSYQARPSMTVRAFVKVAAIVAPLVSVDTWYDDDEPGGPGWVQSEGESTTITTTSVDMKRLLKAKTFNLRFTGLDDEKHLLTFNVRGLAGYLNFLEIKADK